MKKMRVLSMAMAACLAVGTLAGCGANGDKENTLKIGGTGPLTGTASTYGESVKNGAQLAVDEINKDGGVNGIKLEFMTFQDDAAEGPKAKTAYEKLMDDGMQIFMGAVTSGASVALNDLIKKDGILQVTPSASQIEAASENSNAFRICFTDPLQGEAMAKYAFETLKYTKAAIIYNQDDSYSTGIYNAFKAKWAELGGTVSADTSFGKDTSDFSAQVTKIADSDAEFIFMPIYAEKASQIAVTANSKNVKLPMVGCDGIDGILSYLEGDSAKMVEGMIYLTPFIASDPDEKIQKFVKDYKAKYKMDPDQFAADAYDAIYVIKAALEKADIKDASLDAKALGEKLVPVMTQISVDGLTGKMSFTAEGEPNKDAKVAKIVNGAYVAQ